MNVCIINEGGSFGGAEIHTLQMIERIAAHGHSVHVIECGKAVMEPRFKALPAAKVRFTTVPFSTDTNRPSDLPRWMAAIREGNAEHAVFVKNYYLRGSLLFAMAMRLACRRVSYIEHLEAIPAPVRGSGRYFGILPRLELWRHRDRIRRRLPARFADKVVAVSAKVRERLISDCGYPADKISIARNGVKHQDFRRDGQAGERYRASLAIPADRCVVTILARLEYPKGIDIALRAMALSRAQPPARRVHLLIAGTGTLEATLREQTQTLGLGDCVTFAGFLADPKPALWASDGILFSSRREGLPLGLLEGMAAGCVPVVTRVSGMPEVVTRPDLGWIVEPEDAEGLAGALSKLAALDAAALDGYRTRVIAHVEQNFDLERSQQRLLAELGL